jgi:hypothetical protein
MNTTKNKYKHMRNPLKYNHTAIDNGGNYRLDYCDTVDIDDDEDVDDADDDADDDDNDNLVVLEQHKSSYYINDKLI